MGHVDPTPVKPAETKAIPSAAVCLESLCVPGDTALGWASGDLAPDSAVTLGKCLLLCFPTHTKKTNGGNSSGQGLAPAVRVVSPAHWGPALS